MGYANTTMAIYGIKLTKAQAKKIAETLEPICEEGCGIYLETPDKYLQIEIFSENTDSRVHSLGYEDGYSHVFGINYASNGYACDDDIVKAVKKVPKKAIDLYEEYAVKFLDSLKIKTKPDVLIINQVH
jgi:hypothetical protein